MSLSKEKILQTLEFTAIREILQRYCCSSLGKHVAKRLTPLDTFEKASRALRQVSEMRTYLQSNKSLSFQGACDAVGIIEQSLDMNKSVEPNDLHSIGTLLACARWLKTTLVNETEDKPELQHLLAKMMDLKDIEGRIKRTVDAGGKVLNSASLRLAEIRDQRERLSQEIRRRAEAYLHKREVVRLLQDVNVTFRNGRMVLPVRIECRKKINGILHDYSASGNTAFIEPEDLVEKQNLLENKRLQETREISRILWEETRRLIDSKEEIRGNQRIVAWLDFTQARALYARESDGRAPELSTEGRMVLRHARHPLLMEVFSRDREGSRDTGKDENPEPVVPVELHVGDRFDVLVITGPNTGGKTVTLKTAGLLSLMAAAGLHIPAAEGTIIPFFHSILADIGDEQDLSQNLSTFSSHMKRISEILERADSMTLVLLDELGSGTDPLEGEALGRSILSYLLRLGAKVLVSTHLSRLKEFAFSSPRVENACVEFDPDTLRPTFELRIGIPGESNAIRIAKRLGIPGTILEEAENALKIEDSRFKDLMDEMQRVRIQTERALEESQKETREVQKLREETSADQKEWAFKRAVLEQEAERMIDECLRTNRDKAITFIQKLKNLPRPYREDIEALEKILLQMAERAPLGVKRRRYVESLKKGDLVYIPRYREKCRVLKVRKKEDMIEVAYRSLTVKVPSDEVMWPHWY